MKHTTFYLPLLCGLLSLSGGLHAASQSETKTNWSTPRITTDWLDIVNNSTTDLVAFTSPGMSGGLTSNRVFALPPRNVEFSSDGLHQRFRGLDQISKPLKPQTYRYFAHSDWVYGARNVRSKGTVDLFHKRKNSIWYPEIAYDESRGNLLENAQQDDGFYHLRLFVFPNIKGQLDESVASESIEKILGQYDEKKEDDGSQVFAAKQPLREEYVIQAWEEGQPNMKVYTFKIPHTATNVVYEGNGKIVYDATRKDSSIEKRSYFVGGKEVLDLKKQSFEDWWDN